MLTCSFGHISQVSNTLVHVYLYFCQQNFENYFIFTTGASVGCLITSTILSIGAGPEPESNPNITVIEEPLGPMEHCGAGYCPYVVEEEQEEVYTSLTYTMQPQQHDNMTYNIYHTNPTESAIAPEEESLIGSTPVSKLTQWAQVHLNNIYLTLLANVVYTSIFYNILCAFFYTNNVTMQKKSTNPIRK